MNVLDLYERLTQTPIDRREEMMPGRFESKLLQGTVGAWPTAAVGAVLLTGSLSGIESNEDIREALENARRLLDDGIKTQAEWQEEIELVVSELINWGAYQKLEQSSVTACLY